MGWILAERVSFLERKFIHADRDRSNTLSSGEWMLADFPVFFGPFDEHVDESGRRLVADMMLIMMRED